VAFLPALAGALARPLAGQRRNAGFLLVLLALAVANGLFHANAIGRPSVTASAALRCAVDLVAVLLVVIGGRITPAFTRNALAGRGAADAVRPSPGLDRLALVGTAIAAGAGLFPQTEALRGAAALVAGLAVAARLVGWRPWRVLDTPLLWSLHGGQAWLAIGLVATGIAALGGPVPPTLALHALTAGAIGATVLAVMTRVALGHTGRPLEPPRGTALAYGLVNAAALVRVAGPAALPGRVLAVWIGAGLLWAAAFALYLVLYAPMLLRPRVDGKPG